MMKDDIARPRTEDARAGADMSLRRQAEECRTLAVSFAGREEHALLLNLAREFDRLALAGPRTVPLPPYNLLF